MTKTNKVFADGLRVDLFAGFLVSEYAASAAWYERLLGYPPAFLPNDIEAVWELAEHRYIFIKFQSEHAGHAFHLFFLSDLDGFIAQIAKRGLNPTTHETLGNGVRGITHSDPDGNLVGFGGAADMKPTNVLVNSATGQVRLMGFGIASPFGASASPQSLRRCAAQWVYGRFDTRFGPVFCLEVKP